MAENAGNGAKNGNSGGPLRQSRSEASKSEKKLHVLLRTFGCQMNTRDSELVIGQFLAHGYKLTDDNKQADVILLNTCSVRQHAEDKVWSELGALKKLKTKNQRPKTKDAIIGVIGCMAKSLENKIIEKMPHVDLVVGPNDLAHIYDYVKNIQKEQQQVVEVSCEEREQAFYRNLYHQDKKHCYVNTSEGCSNFCSYCVVPYVRGTHHSRPLRNILDEIKQLVKEGVSSITLLGQNVNDYCSENRKQKPKTKNVEFVELVELVSKIHGVKELGFVTSHPKDIDFRLFDLMAEKENIKKQLHLPMQSGSNKILKLMNRKYTREHYIKIIKEYRKRIPDGFIGTDIIVGYPTETEKDFNETLDLMKQVQFDFAYIFKYSPRPHTKAAEIPDDVPLEEKKRRHRILLELQRKISLKKRM